MLRMLSAHQSARLRLAAMAIPGPESSNAMTGHSTRMWHRTPAEPTVSSRDAAMVSKTAMKRATLEMLMMISSQMAVAATASRLTAVMAS